MRRRSSFCTRGGRWTNDDENFDSDPADHRRRRWGEFDDCCENDDSCTSPGCLPPCRSCSPPCVPCSPPCRPCSPPCRPSNTPSPCRCSLCEPCPPCEDCSCRCRCAADDENRPSSPSRDLRRRRSNEQPSHVDSDETVDQGLQHLLKLEPTRANHFKSPPSPAQRTSSPTSPLNSALLPATSPRSSCAAPRNSDACRIADETSSCRPRTEDSRVRRSVEEPLQSIADTSRAQALPTPKIDDAIAVQVVGPQNEVRIGWPWWKYLLAILLLALIIALIVWYFLWKTAADNDDDVDEEKDCSLAWFYQTIQQIFCLPIVDDEDGCD